MTSKPNDVRVSRELLPCPFCGSLDVKIATDDGIHFAQCCKCEATGPTGFKRGDEGDADWNTRAQPADQQDDDIPADADGYPDDPPGTLYGSADQQGEPIGWTTPGMLAIAKDVDGPHSRFGARTNRSARFCVPLYLHAQPATAKVDEDEEFEKAYQSVVDNGWTNVKQMARQVWQARAKLNTPQ